jgi:TolA-binding protein
MSWIKHMTCLGSFCRFYFAAALLLVAPALSGQSASLNASNSLSEAAAGPLFSNSPPETVTSPSAIQSGTSTASNSAPVVGTNGISNISDTSDLNISTSNTNGYLSPNVNPNDAAVAQAHLIQTYRDRLAGAKELVLTRQFNIAETALIALLPDRVPDDIRKEALFELSAAVAGEDDLPRAQSILAQYIARWNGDPRVPEILLRQGEIFRRMGLNNLALGKFYSVMTAALSLKSDQINFYQTLVLQAQIEIAETHYLMGEYDEAAEFYTRLLKRSDEGLNRPLAQFRLVRSLAATTNKTDCVAQAQDFITHYPDDPEAPEVRYYLAQSLKGIGQGSEALRQVLIFLQQEKTITKAHPEVWAYWQQRVGNEIANELYKEGDYISALQVYNNLANLDSSPGWQVPVDYQIGITYERLLQPQKALDMYHQILSLEGAVGTNSTPNLQTVFDMSRWRTNFIAWTDKVQDLNHSMAAPAQPVVPPEISAK